MNIIKEQLKQKNPNYARAQQHLQANRVGKIPEMISLTNKKLFFYLIILLMKLYNSDNYYI
ncbi:MAG: hypothetical protein Q8885_00285 [Candidatus Phytoplasma stylosanthis]|nr:hypothetical protein [Candidatus Phytoplasma stylosanthis]